MRCLTTRRPSCLLPNGSFSNPSPLLPTVILAKSLPTLLLLWHLSLHSSLAALLSQAFSRRLAFLSRRRGPSRRMLLSFSCFVLIHFEESTGCFFIVSS